MKIAVLGFGTVGSGVYEVIKTNYETIAKRAGEAIDIKYVLDLRDFPGNPVQDIITHDFKVIVNDPEVKVVVEVMGGVEPAYTYVKEALLKGKSVCTSNKELVARHGAELLEIAKQKKINFLFEASVGGGIPIIRPLNQSLTADEIVEITGILNGTTNYILSKMKTQGSEFATVLKEAQELGYAERNPEADVEGYDACRKIAILTSLAYGMHVDFEQIYTEGITKITAEDIKYANVLEASIKLLATSKNVDGKVYAMVAPKMITDKHPLFSVNDVFNGILVKGNLLGDVMFYGSGAGKLPTASAVVSDVVDATKHMGTNIMTLWSSKHLIPADMNSYESKFFVRVPFAEEETAKELFQIAKVVTAPDVEGEYAFITEKMTEEAFEEAAKKISIVNRIRVEF
ncbi:homoserine dehydrogenase [Lachnoclostridium phytofermentans]|uniref:homoserine dehydrogenase n=1 Tax=Lachnoclostridium phytofermentans TaxID=66219 RepID=UPI0004957A0D|nr:homoserine dehydrogenase [Lachnoclostridium phytofermentans]